MAQDWLKIGQRSSTASASPYDDFDAPDDKPLTKTTTLPTRHKSKTLSKPRQLLGEKKTTDRNRKNNSSFSKITRCIERQEAISLSIKHERTVVDLQLRLNESGRINDPYIPDNIIGKYDLYSSIYATCLQDCLLRNFCPAIHLVGQDQDDQGTLTANRNSQVIGHLHFNNNHEIQLEPFRPYSDMSGRDIIIPSQTKDEAAMVYILDDNHIYVAIPWELAVPDFDPNLIPLDRRPPIGSVLVFCGIRRR